VGAIYSFSGADPNALLAKSSTTKRDGMLTAAGGARLCKFNELENPQVWDGIKALSNMEAQPITKKKQSSGSTSVHLIETPYVLLSSNKPPPADVKTKVAVITPEMLGCFVDTEDAADNLKTFKKEKLDGSDDAGPMLRAMWLALKEHAEALGTAEKEHKVWWLAVDRSNRESEAGKLLEKQQAWEEEDRMRLLSLSRLKREVQREFDDLKALVDQRPGASA
jgi:hypothetical protein